MESGQIHETCNSAQLKHPRILQDGKSTNGDSEKTNGWLDEGSSASELNLASGDWGSSWIVGNRAGICSSWGVWSSSNGSAWLCLWVSGWVILLGCWSSRLGGLGLSRVCVRVVTKALGKLGAASRLIRAWLETAFVVLLLAIIWR